MESQYPGVRVKGSLHVASFMAVYISSTDQIIKKKTLSVHSPNNINIQK